MAAEGDSQQFSRGSVEGIAAQPLRGIRIQSSARNDEVHMRMKDHGISPHVCSTPKKPTLSEPSHFGFCSKL